MLKNKTNSLVLVLTWCSISVYESSLAFLLILEYLYLYLQNPVCIYVCMYIFSCHVYYLQVWIRFFKFKNLSLSCSVCLYYCSTEYFNIQPPMIRLTYPLSSHLFLVSLVYIYICIDATWNESTHQNTHTHTHLGNSFW